MSITIKALLVELKKYPEDALVLVDGYEGGLSDVAQIKEIKVAMNSNKEEWMGPHEEQPDGKQVAVVLKRANNPAGSE